MKKIMITDMETIFGSVIVGDLDIKADYARAVGDAYNKCMPRFLKKFRDNIFRNEFALFYTMIVDCHMPVFRAEHLVNQVKENKSMILKSPYIDINNIVKNRGFDLRNVTDDEKIEIFINQAVETYKELLVKVVDQDEFDTACTSYVNEYILQIGKNTAKVMYEIMSDSGYTEKMPLCKTRFLKGYDDAQMYYSEQNKIIQNLKNADKDTFNVIDQRWLEDRMEKRKNAKDSDKTIKVGLDPIDKTVGYIRRSNIIGILGPPKGGKTRFTTYLACKFLAEGFNVAVWALEGTPEEWIANILSNMIFTKDHTIVPSQLILEDPTKCSQENRQKIYAAELELSMSKRGRGVLSFIESSAYIETFTDVIKNHFKTENKFDVLIIDSPVLIQSKRNVPKAERISNAYETLKQLVSFELDKKVVGIFPAQLKQSVIDSLRGDTNGDMDVTAGGESASTIRVPDYVWGLFSNKVERNNDQIKIYDVANRHGMTFENFLAECKLGCCYFKYNEELNNQFF